MILFRGEKVCLAVFFSVFGRVLRPSILYHFLGLFLTIPCWLSRVPTHFSRVPSSLIGCELASDNMVTFSGERCRVETDKRYSDNRDLHRLNSLGKEFLPSTCSLKEALRCSTWCVVMSCVSEVSVQEKDSTVLVYTQTLVPM